MNQVRLKGVYGALLPCVLYAMACQKEAKPTPGAGAVAPPLGGNPAANSSSASDQSSAFSLSETTTTPDSSTKPKDDPSSTAAGKKEEPKPGSQTAASATQPPPMPDAKAGATREVPGQGGATPLVLDWNRDGMIRTAVAAGYKHILFDLYGRGEKNLVEWIAPTDAFLALDVNGNGHIDDGTELFGDGSRLLIGGGNAAHGFVALNQYDADYNGLIDGQDPVFKRLLLWQDKNQNGISEGDELTRLVETDVVAIDMHYTHVPTSLGAMAWSSSFIGQRSGYKTRAGEFFEIADVYFRLQTNLFAGQVPMKDLGMTAMGGVR